MPDTSEILEERTFRMLPHDDLGFARPAVEYDDADGTRRIAVSHSFNAPEPELARKADDPGYWNIRVWLPVGATPVALVPDPSAPAL